jgi:hypothetical protein
MRVAEILFWNNEPAEGNFFDSQFDLSHDPSSSLFTKLARAYAKDRLLKRFWNLKGSESQPFGPAPPDNETELSKRHVEPTSA